nr:hypothetical protein [Streptomyces himastatinicus]
MLYVRYTLSPARLGEFPVGVFSADWTLLSWTPAWAVLLGDPSGRTHTGRNLVRAVFASGPRGLAAWPVQQDGDALHFALVADLRAALVTYPRDRGLVELVEELRCPAWHTFSSSETSADCLTAATQSRIRRSYSGSALSADGRQGALPHLDAGCPWRPDIRARDACGNRPGEITSGLPHPCRMGSTTPCSHPGRGSGADKGFLRLSMQRAYRAPLTRLRVGSTRTPRGPHLPPARKRSRPFPLPAEMASDLRKRWSRRQDSNLRPLAPSGAAIFLYVRL